MPTGACRVALAASLIATSAAAAEVACRAPGTQVREPYRWYPALDLARIPFHAAAGPWGPRAPVIAPEPPATTRSVRVTTAAELAREARTAGTLITVDADYIGPTVLYGDVIDIDIVVPPGRRLASLWVGSSSPRSITQRFRLRGTTPGIHSGGVIGRVIFYSDPATDLVIDGVDLNGEDGEGGNLLIQLRRTSERVAVINVRGHAVGPATLGGGTNMVFAGNRIMSGARSREVNGYAEGWGIRAGGRVVVYDNRIEGTRYHRVRLHPGEAKTPEYAWVAHNVFVDRHEARIFDAQEVTGQRSHFYDGVWVVCNEVYAHSKCLSPSFETRHSRYSRLVNNRFYGTVTVKHQELLQRLHGPDKDYLSGNVFLPWRSPPKAWTSPGDPTTSVPLPPVNASRYNASLLALDCPPP